ncbi:Lin1244/Lin1753 domain-containing protein [Vagococcus fluvialis]|uniref:Lin1244/Lin1753 domain-containing protein n=1 Tax=Vagococcus fluvialis TaxID=2738 RepID=UPI003B213A88
MNSYFSHDSNARNSDKLLPVRMKYGAEGYGIYFMLLERLRDESEYMSVKDYNMIAFDLRVDAGKIKSIIEDFGLFVFTECGEYFYSEGFMKRMEIKDAKSKKRSEAGKKGAKKRWGSQNDESDKGNNSNAIAMSSKNIASKEKESKVKQRKKDNSPSADELNRDFELLWELYPKKTGKKDALRHYKNAIKAGTTNKEIQDGIVNYIKFIEINNTDEQYIKGGSTYFFKEAWTDELDLTPKAKSYGNNHARKETLPDWADKQYEETPLSPEEEAVFKEQIRQLAGG